MMSRANTDTIPWGLTLGITLHIEMGSSMKRDCAQESRDTMVSEKNNFVNQEIKKGRKEMIF